MPRYDSPAAGHHSRVYYATGSKASTNWVLESGSDYVLMGNLSEIPSFSTGAWDTRTYSSLGSRLPVSRKGNLSYPPMDFQLNLTLNSQLQMLQTHAQNQEHVSLVLVLSDTALDYALKSWMQTNLPVYRLEGLMTDLAIAPTLVSAVQVTFTLQQTHPLELCTTGL